MEIEVLVSLIILSAAGGFLSGLLGIGGGVIFVPLLTYTFGQIGIQGDDIVNYTLANSFGVIVAASAAATIKHVRLGNISFKYLVYIGVGGVATSIATAYYINHSDSFSEFYFKLFFICILILALLRMALSKRQQAQKELSDMNPPKYTLVGMFTGVISGLTGVGGGIIMVPAFNNIFKLPIKIAMGLSTATILVMSVSNVIQYGFVDAVSSTFKVQYGYLVFDVLIYPILSVLIFAPLGVRAANRINSKWLKVVFVLLLFFIIAKTVYSLF